MNKKNFAIQVLALVVLLASASCSDETTIESPATDTGTTETDSQADSGVDTAAKPDQSTTDTQQPVDTAPGVISDTKTDTGPDDVADAKTDVPDTKVDDIADVPQIEDVSKTVDTGTPPQDTSPDAVTLDKVTEHSNKCSTPADCTIPCGNGICDSGKCKYTVAPGACLVAMGDDKVACYGDGLTDPKADCLSCNVAVAQTDLTSIAVTQPVDSKSEGFKVTAIAGGVSWSFSDKRSVSGGKSLYFGDPLKGSYANDKPVKAGVTSPALAVPDFAGAKPTVQFWLWLETEKFKGYDVLTVSVDDGKTTKQIWSSDAIGGTTHKAWKSIEVDVAAWAGKSIKLNFLFDSVNPYDNDHEGAYIDAISLRTGCCGSIADCDDGNLCSTDTCGPSAGGLPVCKNTLKKGCCANDGDCDDGKPCTINLCSKPGGTCSTNPKPECCNSVDDCDDKDSCTIDHCPKAGASCQHTSTCCKTNAECTSADPCLKGACAGGDCTFSSTCCSGDEECDDFNPCTKDACVNSKCVKTPSLVPGCCSPEPFVNGWESGAEGWKSDPAVKGLSWHQYTFKQPGKANTGNGVWRLAIPGKNTFSNITGSNYVYTHSPQIKLQPNQDYTLEIKFKFEITPPTSHIFYVYMWHKKKLKLLGSVLSNATNKDAKGWYTFTKDMSSMAGETFQLRLRGRIYGYGTNTAGGYGLLLDDLKFKTSCNLKKCSSHSQCVSASTCVQGSCADGKCLFLNRCCKTLSDCGDKNLCYKPTKCQSGYCYFTENKSCCNDVGDCDDGNPCTTDACPVPGQLCKHQTVTGCCLSSSQCNDGQQCTVDTCSANKCLHKNICCKSDAGCDDSDDKCTDDKCIDGKCQWKQTNKPGCCTPLVANYHFNDAAQGNGFIFSKCLPSTSYYTPTGCKPVSGKKPQKGWQVDPVAILKKSPNGALYYGDPNSKSFNFGANSGTVMTPKMKIPQGKSQIEFWIYWDTESGTTYDKTAVWVYLDGVKKNIGSIAKPYSGSLYFAGVGQYTKPKTWTHIKKDTSAWAGKDLQLLFFFNSGDSVGNSGKGVLVDDIKLTVQCGS